MIPRSIHQLYPVDNGGQKLTDDCLIMMNDNGLMMVINGQYPKQRERETYSATPIHRHVVSTCQEGQALLSKWVIICIVMNCDGLQLMDIANNILSLLTTVVHIQSWFLSTTKTIQQRYTLGLKSLVTMHHYALCTIFNRCIPAVASHHVPPTILSRWSPGRVASQAGAWRGSALPGNVWFSCPIG